MPPSARAGRPPASEAPVLRVIWITDPSSGDPGRILSRLEALEAVPRTLRGHVAVQIRAPELNGAAFLALAQEIALRTKEVGAQLIVNDRVDIAMAVGADGLHLGRRSVDICDARSVGFRGFITVSAHAIDEVEARASGAAAVLLSPIFASPEKGSPLGLQALADARARLFALRSGAQLIALGGVDEGNAAQCLEYGAGGVAAIRADLTSGLIRLLSEDAPLVATEGAPH